MVDVVTIVVVVGIGHGVEGVVLGVVVLVEVDVEFVSAVVVKVDVEVVSVVFVEVEVEVVSVVLVEVEVEVVSVVFVKVGVEVVISVQSALTPPVDELLQECGNSFLQAGRQEESSHDAASVVPSSIGSQLLPSQQ